jgi:hypothetical protein
VTLPETKELKMSSDKPNSCASLGLMQAFQAEKTITVYGVPIIGMTLSSSDLESSERSKKGGERQALFAYIKGWGMPGVFCQHLPAPVLLPVGGEGEDLIGEECSFKPGTVKKWELFGDTQTFGLETHRGTVLQILEKFAAKGVSGGAEIENPRIEDRQVCVDVHIWAEISTPFGSVDFDERFTKCISLDVSCITVWDNSWASLELCWEGRNTVCAKLCVGKWGYEKCWKKCLDVPIRVREQAGCSCTAEEKK